MVDRNHHFPPPDAPLCRFCQDGGIYKHPVERDYRVCGCPAGKIYTEQRQAFCDEMNQALRALEKRMSGK